jgi:sortase A
MVGNTVIAAHRDTFFRPLRDVRRHDSIVVSTACGSFEYTVDSTEVVDPHNVSVLRKTKDAELTLVTCFPFTYVGPAPQRIIVHAHRQA